MIRDFSNQMKRINKKPTPKIICDQIKKFRYLIHYIMLKFLFRHGTIGTKNTNYSSKDSILGKNMINSNHGRKSIENNLIKKIFYERWSNTYCCYDVSSNERKSSSKRCKQLLLEQSGDGLLEKYRFALDNKIK